MKQLKQVELHDQEKFQTNIPLDKNLKEYVPPKAELHTFARQSTTVLGNCTCWKDSM